MYARTKTLDAAVSWFVFGPRGTGKTYWLQHAFPTAVYIDLLEARTATRLLADPQRLADHIPAGCAEPVIIDEIQRVPELLNEVHRLIEQRRLRFLMTGSSPRKLRRGGANLLAGRALTATFHPLTAVELGNDFCLEKAISYGMLPTLYDTSRGVDPEGYLASYVETYLREEVAAEGLARQAGAFARFLEAASFSQGQVLNLSEVARECAVKRKTVENYFRILEDLLIGFRLPAFAKRAKRLTVAHPKFYVFDVGVYRAIRPAGPLDEPAQIDGAALETLVFQELRATNENLGLGYDLYFWRTPGGMEIDFVLYGARGIVAIEVKRKRSLSGHDLRGLRTFLNDYPTAVGYVLYGGDHPVHLDAITALPVGDALRRLPELL